MSTQALKATKIAVYAGVTIGLLGWLIGIVGVSLSTGTPQLLGAVLWPGLSMSVALAAIFILVLEAVISRYGARHPMFFGALWGLLLFFMGMLLLLISHWVAPIIDQYPAVVSALQSGGSVYQVSDVIPTILMLIGAAILAVVAVIFATSTLQEEA